MRQLVALAEVRTALFLREGVVDVEPRYLGPDHEVEVGFAPGVGGRVESAEAEPQNLRRRVVTLEDRRTAAASEEPAHARLDFSLKKVLSGRKTRSAALTRDVVPKLIPNVCGNASSGTG